MEDKLVAVIKGFDIEGHPIEIIRYGNGHINDTYRVTMHLEDKQKKRYILQRINHTIFKEPIKLMDNISRVTKHIKGKISAMGGNVLKESINVIETVDGKNYLLHESNYYRCYDFIEGVTSYDIVSGPEDFYRSGQALGKFQSLLSDYDGNTLHETIKDFHNTEKRFIDFCAAVNEDPMDRVKECSEEVQFFMEREKDTGIINRLIRSGALPVRVTHNDTKYNNVMIDDETREAVCLVDLDTVMPGVSLYDFGDSIRSGATTALEDEKDLSLVHFDLSLFKAYTEGYLSKARFLSPTEVDHLPFAAKIMTYECGLRFLKDYIEGDIYYKIDRAEHNLDRARTQIKLLQEMERDFQTMKEIVRESR